MDKYAAKYGRGRYHYHSEIMYGIGVYYLNDVYFTSDKDWKNEGYLFPNHEFVTFSGDTIKVKELNGYCKNEHNFSVFLTDLNNKKLVLNFKNQQEVNQQNPVIYLDEKGYDSQFIDIQHPPVIVTHWRKIVFWLCIVFVFFILGYCVNFFRKMLN